jgi:hypothetical protein
MHDSPAVGRFQCVRNLEGETEEHVNFKGSRPVPVQEIPQSLPVQQFHDDEGPGFVLFDLVNGADVGMVQRRGGPRLALKAPQGGRVCGEFVGKKLKGHLPAQLDVLCTVHKPHAAAAQDTHDTIMGDLLANERVACGPRSGSRGRELPGHWLLFCRMHPLYRNQEPVAAPRQGLDVVRLFSAILEGHPDLPDAVVEANLKIDKGGIAPELLLEFFTGHHLAGMGNQQGQHFEGLGSQADRNPVLAEFLLPEVQHDHTEA